MGLILSHLRAILIFDYFLYVFDLNFLERILYKLFNNTLLLVYSSKFKVYGLIKSKFINNTYI